MASAKEENDKLNESLKNTKGHLQDIKEESSLLVDAITSIGAAIEVAIEDSIKGLDKTDKFDRISQKIQQRWGRDISRSINKVTVSFDQQLVLQEKLNKGIDIQNDLERIRGIQANNLTVIQQRLRLLQKDDSKVAEEELAKLIEQGKIKDDLLDNLEKQNEEGRDSVGILGKIVGGFDGILHSIDRSGNLSRFFNLDKALISTVAQNKATEGGVSSWQSIRNLTSNIIGNLDIQTVKLGAAAFLWSKALGLAKQYDSILAETRRNFELTKEEAEDFNIELDKSTTWNPFSDSTDIGITMKGMREGISSINKGLGISSMLLGKEMAEGASIASNRLKLSEEAITGIAKQSLISGKGFREVQLSQANIVTDVEREYGIRLSVKEVQEAANKLTGQTLVNTMRLPGGIAKAVAVAKSLGVEFEKIAGITASLLDFESSITSELEAELLLGRDLNLERARALTLSGDQEGAMKEIVAQVGTLSDLQSMNVLQQQALAGAVGMSVDQLADMLVTQESINTQIDKSLDRKGSEAQMNAEALSIQEKLALAMENFNATLSKTLGAAKILAGIAAILLAIPTGGASLAAWAGFAGAGAVGLGLAGWGVTDLVNDGVATSDRGPFTITDKYGATSMTAEGDNLAVSPNLSIEDEATPQLAMVQPQISLSPQITVQNEAPKINFPNKVFEETNTLLKMILTKQGNVNINSTKIGTAFSMNSYEVQ